MTVKPGEGHKPETVDRIRATMRDPAKRAEISQATKARMADPVVRERIRAGMQNASGEAAEMQLLRAAWRSARPAVRKRFLDGLLHAACDDQGGEQ